MIRKGNKFIVVVRSSSDLTQIKNNIAKLKDELKDGEQIEIHVAKSGKYMLKMIVSKAETKYEIVSDDKKHRLIIQSEDDVMALKKIIQFLMTQLNIKSN
jgi:antitoxin (DNA-binding transcriptional repressor) of toxin-antitoxin stability system